MGISFKVSKTGTRFRPRPSAVQDEGSLVGESSKESSRVLGGAGSKREAEAEDGVASVSVTSTCSGGLILPEHEVSFTLSLFQKGYFIGKPTEMENLQPLLQDGKSLHPYDRASETLFSAIESGWLPGDILDDIPSKYFDGSLVCEVRDYRKCISEQGTSVSTAEAVPVVNKVRLRMSLENVVKDIPLISDDSWTYSDLMEVESRILKALQPRLHLDPTPMLDRLCDHPSTTKLNLGIGRKKRLRQTLEVIVTSTNQTHGKKVSIDKVSENASCKQEGQGILGYAAMQRVQENTTAQHLSSGIPSVRPTNFAQETAKPALSLPSPTKIQSAINYPGMVNDRVSGPPASFSGASGNISSPQNLMGSYMDAVNGNLPLHGKRENQDAQQTPIGGIKRPKHNALGLDGIQQQQGEPQLVGLNGADLHWKNQLSHSQIDMKGIQYSTVGAQRYPQVINNISNQENMTSFYFNQQGMRFGAKEEQADAKKLQGIEIERPLASENNALEQQQSRSQHLMLQPSMRNHLPPLTQWHNPRPLVDKDMRKDETIQKRKPAQSPRVSSGPMVQSPVSSKSGEFSSGSIGGQFNAVATTSALGSQKEKAVVNSNAAVGAPSVTSSPSDSMHRQIQASVTAKRKSNSVPKTQSMSGVGSPASVSNMNAPLNANSPSIGTAPMSDQQILERFTKFEAVTQRYQLNLKKNKVDDYPTRKATSNSSREVSFCLSNPLNGEDVMDPMKPLSRSLIGGTINTCKTRQITFVRADHTYQGVPTRIQYRLALTEKPFDGTVAMQYGDADDSDFPNTQDCLLTLPTNHHADLLAGQFCVLMERDGYQKTEDQLRPVRMGAASSSPATVSGIASDNAATEVKHPEVNRGQPSNVPALVNNNSMGPLSSSQNLSNSGRMMSSGSGGNQAVPVSQGYLPGTAMPSRAQQLDQPLLQQQQQQQLLMQQNPQSQIQQQQQLPPHIQRSSPLLSTNPLSHLMGQNTSLQMNASHMVNNKPTHLQLQMMQQQAQQQQQQQQSQLPRKMMMGLGAAMGMGNMGNNMVGLGGLGTVMGMGGVRGMSSPMGSMPGLGNVSPNQMNLGTASGFSTGLRPGSLSTAQAAAMASKLRMALQQSRAGMYGSQSGIPGMAGNSNQMLPSSAGLPMLSHALNRANPSQLQRSTMSPMGPPKIPGPNFFLNPHQQLQLMQHQPLQQQQQQQQQQIGSPLQQAQMGSPQVAGSPSAMVMQQQQQQQIGPQQMGQQSVMSPQQLSSGVLQQMNNGGNVGAGPASPQLSTQTHGSVGSITSSPMEQQLQGTNNGGPLNNI